VRTEIQHELIHRFRVLAEGRTTQLADRPSRVPAGHYIGRDQLARERLTLLRRSPVVAALTADVPEPGDFVTAEVDQVPIVVVRDELGAVNAFYNACRHRAAPVAAGRGHTTGVLTCPYHAWSYRLDGRLHGQPLARGCFDVEGDALALRTLPVREVHGLILVRLDGRQVPADFLGGLADDLDSYGLSRHHHVETRDQVVACNWKMVIDTFLEAYHIFSLHKSSIAPLYYSHPMLFDAYGPHLRLIGVRRSIDDLGEDRSEWDLLPHATIHYVVFPNTLVVHQLDHLEVWRVFPDGDDPGRSVVQTSIYAPRSPDEAARKRWGRNLDILLDVTGTEDFPLCESAQRAMVVGAAEGVVLGRNEPALVHFHREIERSVPGEVSPA